MREDRGSIFFFLPPSLISLDFFFLCCVCKKQTYAQGNRRIFCPHFSTASFSSSPHPARAEHEIHSLGASSSYTYFSLSLSPVYTHTLKLHAISFPPLYQVPPFFSQPTLSLSLSLASPPSFTAVGVFASARIPFAHFSLSLSLSPLFVHPSSLPNPLDASSRL